MKAFLAAAVIGIGAMYLLNGVFQRQTDQAFNTGSGVRLPDHGNSHNLVGKTWSSAADHIVDEQHFTGEDDRPSRRRMRL